LLKSEFPNVKVVDLLHAEDYPPIRLEAFAPYIDARICISERLRNYMVTKYQQSGIDAKYISRLHVIHNGIDTGEFDPTVQEKGKFKSRFSIPKETILLSYVGRFSPEKNLLLFVKIAKTIREILPCKVKFVMAGDGPEFANVKARIIDQGLEDQFVLTGVLDDVVSLLKDTFVLLVVSRNEGIPLVVLEAMSMGVPVVSTDVGAIGEVITENGKNGFLIKNENKIVELFTERILLLLNEEASYSAISSKGRETVLSKFSLEEMQRQYQRILD
jgi:L-malate glycosyltransferase